MIDWTLNVRGLKIVVRELSDGATADGDIPIICLHGWLDHGVAFSKVAAGQPGRWIAPDQRGFGQSDHLGPGGYYHFADLIPDLDALVDKLGGQVNLLGHSMGGTVASIYAAVRPEKVHRLVVAEGLGALESGTPNMVERIRSHLDQIRHPPAPVRIKSVADAAQRLLKRHTGLSASLAEQLAIHGTTEDSDGVRWSFDPLHMVQGPYPFREQSYLTILAEIKAPTLVIWATASWYSDHTRTLRAMTIPDVKVATLKGGHMLPYDAPAKLGALATAHFKA
jgi:pimeloyl-ACP methyl ester carboxylesterase